MKVLIIYKSKYGQTKKIAEFIAKTYSDSNIVFDIFNVEKVLPSTEDVLKYQKVIILSGLVAGGYGKSINRFISENLNTLSSIPCMFISVCLAINSKLENSISESKAIPQRFVNGLGLKNAEIEVVAGCNSYTKYNFLLKYIMKRIARKEGSSDLDTSRNYEYTNWENVKDIAIKFAKK